MTNAENIKQHDSERLPNGSEPASKQYVFDMLSAAGDEVFDLIANDLRKAEKRFTEESLELLHRLMALTKEMEAQRIMLQNITQEVFGNVEHLPKFIGPKGDTLQ